MARERYSSLFGSAAVPATEPAAAEEKMIEAEIMENPNPSEGEVPPSPPPDNPGPKPDNPGPQEERAAKEVKKAVNEIKGDMSPMMKAIDRLNESIDRLVRILEAKEGTPNPGPVVTADSPEAPTPGPGETLVASTNPGVEGADTGKGFIDPKTKEKIRIMRKKDESPDEAIKRVAEDHGVSPSAVKAFDELEG